MTRRVLVVGDGGWGTALSLVLAGGGHDVRLWSYDPSYAAQMSAERTNSRYLPGFDLPPSIRIGSDFAALVDGAELLVSAVPTTYLRDVWTAPAGQVPAGVPVVSVSKGLEEDTNLRPSQVLAELTGPRPLAVLSGPNIAREIAAGLPAATVVASEHEATVRLVQQAFNSDRFRVYSNRDLKGVELGGVLKNVIALAAGMCDGMELGTNAKAALLTRGVVEMARVGEALGGRRQTFFGLAGLGDLLTTCYSPVSRNRTFGERLGRGEHVADIAASMKMVAEGVKTSRPVHELMAQHDLVGPINEQVYLVIHAGKSPRDVVASLMGRGPKDESADLFAL